MNSENRTAKNRRLKLPPLRLRYRLLLYFVTAICVALSLIEVTFQYFPYAAGIAIYGLAAVTLAASCYYIIVYLRRDIRETIRPAIASNPYANRVTTDYRLRTILFAVPGMVSNLIFALFNGVIAVTSRSAWFGTLAAYYLLLGMMRTGVVMQERKIASIHDTKERMEKEIRVYRRNSTLFLFMAVVLSGAVILLQNSEGGKNYPGFMIYAVAAYTFYKIIMSTIQVIKVGKRRSPLLSITRRIGYIDACVSILTLQTAMFASFSSGEEQFIKLMNGSTGTVVCLMVIGLGIQGILSAMRQRAALSERGNRYGSHTCGGG